MSTLADAFDELNAQLDEQKLPAKKWDARDLKPGDRLLGEVKHIKYANSANGVYGVLTLHTVDRETFYVNAYHQMLKNQLVEKRVQVGDYVGIRFDGSLPKSSGEGSYFAYHVSHVPNGERRSNEAFAPDAANVEPDLGFLPDVEPQR